MLLTYNVLNFPLDHCELTLQFRHKWRSIHLACKTLHEQ